MHRNIVELLKILKEQLENHINFQEGLCSLVDEILNENILNSKECQILFNYIKYHRPIFKPTPEDLYELETIFSIIFLEKGYWGWYPGLKEPRLKWIDEHIELNS